MRRPLEESLAVFPGEVGRQECDPAQVKAPVAQHREDHRVLAGGPRHGDAQVGLRLREVQGVRAIREHRREGLAREEPSGVHLGDVGDQLALDTARLREDLGQPGEEIVIGEPGQGSAFRSDA